MKHHREVTRTYACNTCPKTFSQKQVGRKHVRFNKCEWKLGEGFGFRVLGSKKGITIRDERVAESSCPFCGQDIPGSRNALMQHLGRHLEEISFAVVAKPYKEWQFYEDSVSCKSSAPSIVLNESLCKAVSEGNLRQCMKLLSAGADVNSIESGKSALSIACTTENRAIIWLLLQKGADPELGSVKPLDSACREGKIEIVSLLAGIVQDPDSIEWAMKIAINNFDFSAFRKLFQSDRNFRIGYSSILSYAAGKGNLMVVQFLLASGVALDTDQYDVAISRALNNGHKDVITVLAGNSMHFLGSLWYDAGKIGDIDIIEVFLARETFIKESSDNRCSLPSQRCRGITGAASKGHIQIIERLLEFGTEIEAEAIELACRYEHEEVVLLLLEKGGKHRPSHISIAAESGYILIMKHLLRFGAKATPEALLNAVEGGHLTTFIFLDSKFPDLLDEARKNNNDKDIMGLAYEGGTSDIVIRLVERGVSASSGLLGIIEDSSLPREDKAKVIEEFCKDRCRYRNTPGRRFMRS
ncbi:Ankyrin-1 [Dactylella cylindrospora]|nr:Ankyrin-1 [Dactylella cylindrospora]